MYVCISVCRLKRGCLNLPAPRSSIARASTKFCFAMCTVRCCPLWHPTHCPMETVPRVLVRRTASPAHADFGGLSSEAAPVVIRLDVVPLPPRSSDAPTVAGCRLGGYPAGRDRWGGKRAAGGMDHDRCFSMLVLGAFSTGVFQHQCIIPH